MVQAAGYKVRDIKYEVTGYVLRVNPQLETRNSQLVILESYGSSYYHRYYQTLCYHREPY